MKRANLVRIFAVFLSLVLVVSAMLPLSSLAASNDKVQKVADSVVQVLIVHIDPITGAEYPVSNGTGFVVSKNIVITADHVTNIEHLDLTNEEIEKTATLLGYTPETAEMEIFRSNLTLMVTISRDVRENARRLKNSSEADWAILEVDQGIANKQPLTLRRASDAKRTETCHVLGFPVVSQWVQDVQAFDSDDVTIGSGTVVKVDTGVNMWSGATYDYVQTNAVMISGNSGGPLVDDEGNVLGVCQGYWKEADSGDGYYYASTIDQIIPVLEAYGIPINIYDPAEPTPTNPPTNPPTGGPDDPDPTGPVVNTARLEGLIKSAEGYAKDEYTAKSYKALQNALDDAKDALDSNDQAKIDDACADLSDAIGELELAEGDSNMLIIIIAAAVLLVIIVVVIIIIVSSGKKNKAPAAAPASVVPPMGYAPQPGAARPAPPVRPVPPAQSARPVMDTNPMPAGNGETTLLSSAGETTILSASVAGGTLVRTRNSERIVVNAAEFVLGRERSQTNYCISDNTSVGRTHAKIVVRDGKNYLVDMKSRNGTYLNGARLTAMQENELKAGDVIKLADEEFTFQG